MHEMSIAQGILDIVLKTAAEHNAVKISCIKLLIGQMTQVEPESLKFGFAALAANTIADSAVVDITIIPLVGKCNSCGQQFTVERYSFLCPLCHSANILVVSGRELAVDYLEVE
ncbi:hydrogenase nickel incorporation protein HypA/HybF [Pelosinus fermentans]|uniref:hydrogenase maturation nickel metallochaperone HypA n=1 Tax=Pelosinus fermentans TaxID=365349 RepID=UPI0002684B34|nr:hydrogenase maturation nickel metallochaperone HypA [Pelosinus fermentans]OAM96585.1 hydrogenase nickel incorporation protein hypA [Pelosinus fermentans DSM 17108]SDR41612.1 hydrogenase nickel incorporation protein HypA/HybF [Pelosinus fermentans]